MTQPLASTQRDQVLSLLKQRGMTRRAEFESAGITGTTVSRMERAGEIVRLARRARRPERQWRQVSPRRFCRLAVQRLVYAWDWKRKTGQPLMRANPLFLLVRLAGFEPTTPWFVAKYSIQLSYSREAVNYSSGRRPGIGHPWLATIGRWSQRRLPRRQRRAQRTP